MEEQEFKPKYYAHINSKGEMTGIDMSLISADAYGSKEVMNIEVDEEIYNNRDMYIYVDGQIIVDPLYDDKQADKFRAELVNKIYDIKAEKAYGGVLINETYKFETNQTSITNTVASLALMGNDSVANWKFYVNDEPVVVLITKMQLAAIAGFGQQMINQCFAIEGEADTQLREFTTEQLLDETFREGFLLRVKEFMDAVDNKMTVQFNVANEE